MKQIIAALVTLAFGVGIAIAQTAPPPDAKVNPQTGEIEIADPVWVDTNYDIRYVINPGRNATTFDLATDPADDMRPRLAIADNGDAWVVWWRDVATPQVLVRKHDHAGGGWSAETALGEAGTAGSNPEIEHDGTYAWIAFEAQVSPGTVIRVSALDDDPTPFGGYTSVASTTFADDLDLRIRSKGGQLWVTWTDSASDVGWCQYDYAAELWSLPGYEPYAGEGTHPALQQIEAIVLGE